MTFEIPSLEDLVEIEKAEYRARISGIDTSTGSDADIEARVHAAAVRSIHGHAAYLLKQILPSSMDGATLIEQCRIRDIIPKTATASTGYVMVYGTTAGNTVSIGTTMTHAGGKTYTTNAGATLASPTIAASTTVGRNPTRTRIPVIGTIANFSANDVILIGSERVAVKYVLSAISALELWAPMTATPAEGASITTSIGTVIAITATSTGSDGNKDARDTLTFSPTGNVNGTAMILELASGSDDETETELRGRFLDWLADRPGSGNLADYRSWARTTPDVGCDDAFVYPGFDGLGTVAVVPFGVSGARRMSTGGQAAVLAQLEANASPMDLITVYDWTYSATTVAGFVTVKPAPGYEPDWSGSYTVSTGSTTTNVVLTTSPANIEVGDRVVVYTDVLGIVRGYQRTVVGMSLTGTYSITLDEALPEAPVSTDVVLPGGPLFDAIDDALDAIEDSRGPGDTATASRYPEPMVAFDPVMRASDLIASIKAIQGVVDVGVTQSDGSSAWSASGYSPAAMERLRFSTRRITWV